MKYRLLIIDGTTYQTSYVERMKTSYGGHRIITSSNQGRIYTSIESAEADALLVKKYYSGPHRLKIIECE